jgi:hypothetical protein
MGQEPELDPLQQTAKEIAGKLFTAIGPEAGKLASHISEATQPMVRTIVREEVMPKATMAIVAGMAVAAAIGAITASLITKGRRG